MLSVPSATSSCPARTILTWKSPMKQPACLMRRKKSKQKGGVNTELSPSILLDVSVTGREFVLAAAVDKKEGEASSSGLSESGKVSEQCDKTFSPSSADLMSVLCKINSKFDSLNSAVNEVTGTVFELKNEK